MAPLARELRKDFERTIKHARHVAEAGAYKAVGQLGVGEGNAPKHLDSDSRKLRNRLRAHGRQLGDHRDANTGTQAIFQLVQECAYEHWHRMLFARFLADNYLLIEPDSGVAVSLDEVRQLAREKSTDWLVLASDFAEQMLPQIFRKGDPVLEIMLPPETRSELEDLLNAIPRDVFEADDSLGWVYQFWQADRKDEVNESATKIGPDELSAVTQLFTEDYMVLSLVHNTIGSWWAGKILASRPELASSAAGEDELRAACNVGDVEWTYLRFARNAATGSWRPAAGTFSSWPHSAKLLTILDPCMGSGHFLVSALPIVAALRMTEEQLDHRSAFDAVLRDNLYGLEIDPRCTQIAAFNLAFSAWRRTGYRELPRLNLACSGLSPRSTSESWTRLAGGDPRLRKGMEQLYRIFRDAPVLGSLINPGDIQGDLIVADFQELRPLLEVAFSNEKDDTTRELAVAASGIARAVEILAREFCVVMTNVPFLAKNKQVATLQEFSGTYYPRAATDLATVFIERTMKFLAQGGTAALVVPRIWMTYTAYYKALRSHLLRTYEFSLISHVGKGGFETISGEIVDVSLICLSNRAPKSNDVSLINASKFPSPASKADGLRTAEVSRLPQDRFLKTPGLSIIDEAGSSINLLSDYVSCYEGLSRGDVGRFDRYFWELPSAPTGRWTPLINSSSCDEILSGADVVFLWENGNGALAQSTNARVQGEPAWGCPAVFVSRTHLNACLTQGSIHAQNGVAIVPDDAENLLPILLFCRSEEYKVAINKLNQKLIKPTGVMDKVAFELERWRLIATQTFPGGAPAANTPDPTQLYFRGEVHSAHHPLQVAVARLLGYRWPRQMESLGASCPVVGSDGLESHEAADGIVCLASIQSQPPGAERLTSLLRDAYKGDWSAAKLGSLLGETGFESSTLDNWLRFGFFKQHCVLFRQRPFIWHIWDGRKDGFHALVNYHRLAQAVGDGRRTLEKLTYAYLGDWIDRQRAEQKSGIEGADARLAAATRLKVELERILKGEPPYDLFVRWKPLSAQPIGWEPNVEDGVLINIRPFMMAQSDGNNNAPVLRIRPNLNWKKSSGKEIQGVREEFPWLYEWDGKTPDWSRGAKLSGERNNDCHYSVKFKQSARWAR